MDEQIIRAYWKALNYEMRANEMDSVCGKETDTQTIIGLAARIIEGVNALEQPSKTMLLRHEYAAAFITAYQPIPAPKETCEPHAYRIMDAAFVV